MHGPRTDGQRDHPDGFEEDGLEVGFVPAFAVDVLKQLRLQHPHAHREREEEHAGQRHVLAHC